MKKPDLKILLLFLMVFSYVIIKIVFNINSILNTFIWLLIFIIANILSISNYDRFKNDNSKISTIFITSISILMIYFLSGLLFGYSKNVLFSNINNIITNSWCYIIIIFFEEYMRQLFISYSKDNKIILFLISLIFIANDINFYSSSFYNTFVNIFLIYIPICLKHFLLTYITYNYGYKN